MSEYNNRRLIDAWLLQDALNLRLTMEIEAIEFRPVKKVSWWARVLSRLDRWFR